MAFAIDTYTGDGSTVNYSVTFPYIEEAHVVVTLDGVTKTLNTDYSFTTSSTITFTTAPSASAVIKFTRSTSQTSRLVDYQDGSTLTEATLDQDGNQSFYMAQEAIDITENTISLSTSTDQWDADNKRITNLASPVDDSDAVTKGFISTNLPNITTVAGISSDVTSVANNNTDISTVAGEISPTNNISTVAGLDTEITSLGAISADITTVANNETDIQTLADLEDGTTATNGLSTLAGIDTEITGVYNIRNNVTNVDGNSADISTVAGQISPTNNIQTVAGLNSEITTLGGLSTEITNVEANNADITTVAGQISPTNNISTLAGLNTELSALYNIRTDITAVANISTDIQDVQDKITELQTVANDLNEVTSEIETVAGSIANVDAVGADLLGANNIQTVANNLASVNSFANTYLGASATPPTQDPDGSSLDLGDLYFDSASDTMKVYSSGGWINAGSAVNGTANRFKYTATASQTTFTGADDNSASLAYDAGFLDVYLNGIKLVNGSDFTATTGNSVVLTVGASANDILEIIAYGTFDLANFSVLDATDTPASFGTAGQALVVNSGGTGLTFSNASSAEVYGFRLTDTDSDGVVDTLQTITTNGGDDNIDASTYASFDDVVYASTGFSWSLDNNGHLIATI